MTKPKSQSVDMNDQHQPNERLHDHHDEQINEPLSGSKKVKNRNHSRNNHGEGS